MTFEIVTTDPRTGRVAELPDLAADRARLLGHDRVGTEHLLATVLGTGYGGEVFAELGIAVEPLVERRLGRSTGDRPAEPTLTASAVESLRLGVHEGTEPGNRCLSCLLRGLIEEGEGTAARTLAAHGVTVDRVREAWSRATDRLVEGRGADPARRPS